MIAVRMDILGVNQLDFAIGHLLAKIDDWRDLWPTLARRFYEIETRLFASFGGSGRHGLWRSLSSSYWAHKQRVYPGRPILQREGNLVDSLTIPGSYGAVADMSRRDRFIIGTAVRDARSDAPYPLYLMQGTSKMPARRPIDFTQQDNLAFAKEFHLYVNRNALKGFDGRQRRIPFGVGAR